MAVSEKPEKSSGKQEGAETRKRFSGMTPEKEYEQRMRDSIREKLERSLKGEPVQEEKHEALKSRQYQEFRQQYLPKHLSIYEKACNISEKVMRIAPDKKELPALQEAIEICHLNITPAGAKSFSILGPLALILLVLVSTYMVPFILTGGEGTLFFTVFALLAGLIMIIPLGKLPYFFANNWRLAASNQMVLCTFYMVTYMRHTSNLENALDFAAEHLSPPLSLDIKKVVWNLETEKYESVKESLDVYLETWKKWNMEFIESVHLIESSLYEGSEDRRINALDKSLSVMLEETYEKMLHYAHNLQSPLAMLHMLGIILPILGLVVLPLIVGFIEEVKWYHLFTLYNIALPIGVYYLGKSILATRPTGYGQTDISNRPDMERYRNVTFKIGGSEFSLSPAYFSFIIIAIFLAAGFIPLIMHWAVPGFDMTYGSEGISFINNWQDPKARIHFLGYKEDFKTGEIIGPYGLGAALISLCIPLGLGLGFGMYFKLRSKNVIKLRDDARKLEEEFAAALFQLGNRLGDQLPPEIAFSKVSRVMEGTKSGDFFQLVSGNISKLGMSVEQAIFDEKRGALVSYPSNLIESSMKVLVESSKKGPLVASQAVINVSQYIKEMHRVDERLKDLMADIISSMKSQISFLAPAIAGVVIGITSMIITILGDLGVKLNELAKQNPAGGTATGTGLLELFGNGVPTYFFQIIVGLYVVQIVYILTVLVNGIQNGSDKLNERYMLGQNLVTSTVLYCTIAVTIMLIFNIIAGSIIGSLAITAG